MAEEEQKRSALIVLLLYWYLGANLFQLVMITSAHQSTGEDIREKN